MISRFGERSYELFFQLSMVCITAAHAGFLLISLNSIPKKDNPSYKVMPDRLFNPLIGLCLVLTAGHAMMTTLQAPAVNKYVTDKGARTRIFSISKIGEGIIISTSMYVYGFVR